MPQGDAPGVNGCLRRTVHGYGGKGRERQARGDIHDGGLLLPPEMWKQLRGQIRDDLVIGLTKILRPFQEVDLSLNSRVVDQDIELFELGQQPVHQGAAGARLGNVADAEAACPPPFDV